MGFFSDVSSFLNGGSKSESSGQSTSGFSLLPPELQAAFKDYAPLISQFTNPTNAANVERFTPTALTSGETSALARMGEGFTPDQEQLNADIAMQQNPFDSYVIDGINREAQGSNSILNQSMSEAGQFGSNRGILGANDIDLTRLNLIGKFKQGQYDNALNNSLNTLTNSRRNDAGGALSAGSYARDLDMQTKQAPIKSLQTFGQLLGAIPQSGGSQSTQSSKSSSEEGMGKNIAAAALMLSDIRLKQDIEKIGVKNGYNLYSFRYVWSPIKYIGVMAQEILKIKPEAVQEREGYLAVDYSQLGFEMVRA